MNPGLAFIPPAEVPGQVPAPAPAASPWAPFQRAAFRTIWLAAFASDVGLWMQNVSASWLTTRLTSSVVLISLMVTAANLPAFLLGIPAGVLADIFNRRRILLLTQAWMTGIALLLGLAVLLGYATPGLLLALSFLLAVGPALNETAWQAVVPDLVPAAELPAAISLNGVSINLARVIGPAVGGLILAYYSPGWVFLLAAACFLATLVVVYRWAGPAPDTLVTTLQAERFVSAMRAGVQYVRYAPATHPVLGRAFAFTFGSSALWSLLSAVVARQLHQTAGVYSLLLCSLGAGSIVGVLLLGRLTAWLTLGQRLALAALLMGGGLLALARLTALPLLAAGLVVAGIGWITAMSGFNVAIQTDLPAWVRARVISLYLLTTQGGMALGGAFWGTLAGRLGLVWALQAGALLLAATLLLGWLLPLAAPVAAPAGLPPVAGPAGDLAPPPTDGMVLIEIAYTVRPADVAAFAAAAGRLAAVRQRTGSTRVGLFADVAVPTRLVEVFLAESWREHEQQRARFSAADQATEAAVRAYQTSGLPAVTHLLALGPDGTRPAGPAPADAPS